MKFKDSVLPNGQAVWKDQDGGFFVAYSDGPHVHFVPVIKPSWEPSKLAEGVKRLRAARGFQDGSVLWEITFTNNRRQVYIS